jgi:hypothetical protein
MTDNIKGSKEMVTGITSVSQIYDSLFLSNTERKRMIVPVRPLFASSSVLKHVMGVPVHKATNALQPLFFGLYPETGSVINILV